MSESPEEWLLREWLSDGEFCSWCYSETGVPLRAVLTELLEYRAFKRGAWAGVEG